MNKNTLLAATIAFALLTACKPISNSPEAAPQQPAQAPRTQSAESSAQPAKNKPKRATPERIAQIVASGRKGLWASVTTVCPKERPVPTTVLTWNASDSGAEKVMLHIVDPYRNTDRPFGGKQSLVGERETGHWLKPGLMFKLRSADGGQELGSVTIGEKAC